MSHWCCILIYTSKQLKEPEAPGSMAVRVRIPKTLKYKNQVLR